MADLKHRWKFEDNLEDSVGGADGSIESNDAQLVHRYRLETKVAGTSPDDLGVSPLIFINFDASFPGIIDSDVPQSPKCLYLNNGTILNQVALLKDSFISQALNTPRKKFSISIWFTPLNESSITTHHLIGSLPEGLGYNVNSNLQNVSFFVSRSSTVSPGRLKFFINNRKGKK
jgi:hypothetical protein